MSALRMIYLGCAIIGAIIPMYHFLIWMSENGYALAPMIDAWYVNSATTGLVWDLTIAACVLTFWICVEVSVRKDYWVAPISIITIFCIGVSCGLPLYLFLRSRPIN